MGLLCETKALLKWTPSVLFSPLQVASYPYKDFCWFDKIFSDKFVLPIANVFVTSYGKKMLKRWKRFARDLKNMYFCWLFFN